jgi:hypothetical protein
MPGAPLAQRRGLVPKNPVPPRASGSADVVSTTSTPPPGSRSHLLCAPPGARSVLICGFRTSGHEDYPDADRVIGPASTRVPGRKGHAPCSPAARGRQRVTHSPAGNTPAAQHDVDLPGGRAAQRQRGREPRVKQPRWIWPSTTSAGCQRCRHPPGATGRRAVAGRSRTCGSAGRSRGSAAGQW